MNTPKVCIARDCGKTFDASIPEQRTGLRSFWQRYCPACRTKGNAGAEAIVNTPSKAGRSKRAKAAAILSQDEMFFYDHAGCSHGPNETAEQGRIRGARALAKAESEAKGLGWVALWDFDEEGCTGCDCGSADCACGSGAEHETLWAHLVDENGKTLGSLCGICGATAEYRRVVEAELACEAVAEYDRETEVIDAH